MNREKIAGTDRDHVFLLDDGERKTFRCDYCGAEVGCKLPMRLDDFVQTGKLFARQHRKCHHTA